MIILKINFCNALLQIEVRDMVTRALFVRHGDVYVCWNMDGSFLECG